MKSTVKILVSVLALSVMASSPALRAQDTSTPPPAGGQGGGQRGGRGGGRGGFTPEQQIARLEEAVGKLTDDQKTKITAIYTDSQKEMQDARGSSGGDRAAMMEKMQEINKKAHDAVRALLTEDQQKKFDAMPPPARGGGRGRRGGGGGGGAPGGGGGGN